jgi:hypothetical protein
VLKKKTLAIIIPAFLGASIITGSLLYSVTNADGASTPGSADDPVITKSYVDQQLKLQITAEADKVRQELLAQIQQNPSGGGASEAKLEVVQLDPGKSIIASAGTELIVRTGKTIIISTDENGVPDTTAGKDLAPGAPVITNHLLMIPRDGRGVKVDPRNNGDVFVMIKGSYQVK